MESIGIHMESMNPLILWIPMDWYGFLWIPYGFIWIPLGSIWIHGFHMDSYEFLWIRMNSYEYQYINILLHQQYIIMIFHYQYIIGKYIMIVCLGWRSDGEGWGQDGRRLVVRVGLTHLLTHSPTHALSNIHTTIIHPIHNSYNVISLLLYNIILQGIS